MNDHGPAVVWRPVPGYPKYEVSSTGEVRGGRFPGRLLKHEWNGKPARARVKLYLNGQPCPFGVHVLVALAFHGPKPDWADVVRHLNDVPSDNRPENLAYGTHRDNTRDAIRNGVHPNVGRTHCRRGHPFDATNTHVTPQGYRVCKECKRTKTREDRARRGGIYRARAKARRQGGTA